MLVSPLSSYLSLKCTRRRPPQGLCTCRSFLWNILPWSFNDAPASWSQLQGLLLGEAPLLC